MLVIDTANLGHVKMYYPHIIMICNEIDVINASD